MKGTMFLIAITALFLGCSSELNEAGIVGKWKMTDFKTNTDLSLIIIASAKKIALTNIYQINQDHTFTLTNSYQPKEAKGEWKLNSEPDQIEFYFEDNQNGKPTIYKIDEFSANKMIWIEDMGDLGQNTYTLER